MLSHILTMKNLGLCIMQYTYWTPLTDPERRFSSS